MPPDWQSSKNTSGWRTLTIFEGILRTFGSTARYDDEAWGEHFEGSSGVRSFYEQLMAALPDLLIDVQRRHLTDDSIVLEVIIRGTHLGPWRGLPATGRKLEDSTMRRIHLRRR